MKKELTQVKRVVWALFVRELKTRFGKYRLGYLWALLEPFMFIALFVGIRGILAGSLRGGVEKFIYHVDYPLFLAAGLVPFFMFKHTVNQLVNTIEANIGLFVYQPVKPFDAFIARWLLEGLVYTFVWIIVFKVLYFLNFRTEIKDPLTLLMLYLLFYFFAFGVGITFCLLVNILKNIFPELRNIISMLMLFLFFTSGIFFSINNIPPKFQIYLLWNPCLHFIELSRASFFPLYEAEECSLIYVIVWTFFVLFLGLSLYRLKIREVLASE